MGAFTYCGLGEWAMSLQDAFIVALEIQSFNRSFTFKDVLYPQKFSLVGDPVLKPR